jgi:hypothetical protein
MAPPRCQHCRGGFSLFYQRPEAAPNQFWILACKSGSGRTWGRIMRHSHLFAAGPLPSIEAARACWPRGRFPVCQSTLAEPVHPEEPSTKGRGENAADVVLCDGKGLPDGRRKKPLGGHVPKGFVGSQVARGRQPGHSSYRHGGVAKFNEKAGLSAGRMKKPLASRHSMPGAYADSRKSQPANVPIGTAGRPSPRKSPWPVDSG